MTHISGYVCTICGHIVRPGQSVMDLSMHLASKHKIGIMPDKALTKYYKIVTKIEDRVDWEKYLKKSQQK